MWKVFVLGTKYLYQNTLLTHFPDGFKLQGCWGADQHQHQNLFIVIDLKASSLEAKHKNKLIIQHSRDNHLHQCTFLLFVLPFFLSLLLRKWVIVRLPEFNCIGCSCLFLFWRLLFEPFFHGYANHIATFVWCCTWCQHAPTVKTVFRIIAHGPYIEQRGNPTQHTRQDSQPMVPKHGHVPNHCFLSGVF